MPVAPGSQTAGRHGADPKSPLNFNKACEIEDFRDPDLLWAIREVCPHKVRHFGPDFPVGFEYNKDWEVGMAVRSLHRLGALGPGSMVLGVAAGTEDTLFYLTHHAKLVFATDRYLGAKEWSYVSPLSMLVDPAALAPFGFDENRLVVQHMDGRCLRFPDNTFDGIFSSGSIEHFGDLGDVAAAAYEMGRVLRPGGVLSLATVVRAGGPARGPGFTNTLVLTPEELDLYIIQASGLEPVDELDLNISEATMSTNRALLTVMQDKAERLTGEGEWAGVPEYALWDFPHLILEHEGYIFDSVHLALRKPETGHSLSNGWAKPSASVSASIKQFNDQAVAQASSGGGSSAGGNPGSPVDQAAQGGLIDTTQSESEGQISQEWRVTRVVLPSGPQFELVIDTKMHRPIVEAYLGEQGEKSDWALLAIMLSYLRDGGAMVDLGAFLGTFSLAAAAAGSRALAVDASPDNIALLRASVIRNGFSGVYAVHAAVGDTSGSAEFCPDGPWGHVATGKESAKPMTVPAVRVDDLIERLGWERVDFVKMDVEGSEVEALKGMHELLSSSVAPPILYEANGHTLRFYGLRTADLLRELERFGYMSYWIADQRFIPTRASDLQSETVVNYLAVKDGPPDLPGWTVAGPMSQDERVGRLLSQCRHESEDHRANIAWILRDAEDDLLSHPAVRRALGVLKGDPSHLVRSAAGWWPGYGREQPRHG